MLSDKGLLTHFISNANILILCVKLGIVFANFSKNIEGVTSISGKRRFF